MIKLIKYISILVVTCSLTLIPHNVSYAKEKKLKYEKNSALALNYHRVRSDNYYDKFLSVFSNSKELSTYSVTDTEFEKQIKWLKKHDAHFLTEKEFLAYKEKGKFPKRSVWINFDDMDQSIYSNAAPILKKYHVPATGFVITGEVGKKNFHNLNILNKQQLLKMKRSGLWNFSSHTHRQHTLKNNGSSFMIGASNTNLTADLKESNQYLKRDLNTKNKSLAYPYGQVEDHNIKTFKKSGIKYGYTLSEQPVTPDDDNYYIPRILVSKDAFNTLIKSWKGFDNEK